MNKNLHRIIFNAARGVRMAVSEVATSQRKSASGGSVALSLVLAAPFTLTFALTLTPQASAQIIADRNAPRNQQPTIVQSASGVPQVNIQTPSAGGVSRNTYSQFDVNKAGVILNNSRTDTPTQLGGYVQGNPWLATGSARVILNEVNSTNPSQLKGYIEVAGPRTEVIIANPAGISVDGGGFINASAVTLTTGSASMNAGSLESYQVRGGSVSVDGAGLDTGNASYTNILARAVQANAGIWAQDLKVVTGANDISASSAANPAITATASTASSAATTAATPTYALDVAALGGMYARHIYLVGTEAGVGVRNSGVIGATAGDVTLSTKGWLSNSGSIYAAGNTSITALGSIANTAQGLIAAQGNTTLQAQGAAGQISSDKTATLAAGMDSQGNVGGTSGSLTVAASTSASLSGKVVAAADANLQAQTLTTDGASVSAAQLNIAAHDLSNVGGKLQQSGTGDMVIALPGNLDNTGGTIASNAQNLTLSASTLTNAGGGSVLHAGTGTLAVAANSIAGNGGTIVSNGALDLQGNTVDLQGATTNAQQISIQASSLSNQGGRIVQASSTRPGANISVTGALDNTGGLIGSNSALHINAGSVNNANAQIVALQSLDITSSGAVTNTAGLVQSGATLSVNASQINNAATYTAPASTATALGLVGNDIQLSTNSLNNQGGEVLAGNNLTIEAAQSIDNSLRNNQGGLLYAAKALTVRTLQVANAGGTLNAGASQQIQVAGISGDGKLLSQGDLSLDVSGDFNNTGVVNANGNASITSAGTLNNSGTLSAGQTLSVAAVDLNNTASGVLSGTTATNVTLGGTLTNRGLIDSGNNAGTSLTRIQAQTVNNIGTGRIYGDNVAIAAGTLTNDAETLTGVTKTAVIASRNRLDLGVQTLNNNNGASILSLGDMAIGGALDANNRATGSAGTVTNSASTIQSVNGNVTINAASLHNLNPTFSYAVVSGATSAEKTEYILTNGQTIQDTEVVADNGKLTGYTVAGGFTDPYGKVLLKTDPLATPQNVVAYKTPDVYTPSSTSCTSVGDGNQSCTYTPAVFQQPVNSSVWSTLGMVVPALAPPAGPRPASGSVCISGCDGDNQSPTYQYVDNSVAEAAWDASATPYYALQTRLTTLRSNMDTHMVTVQAYNVYTATMQQALVNGGAPATISSGGNLTINASSNVHNDNSRILAGGALAVNVPGGGLDNTSTNATVQNDKTGYNFNWKCVNFVGHSVCGVAYYNQGNIAGNPELRENQFTQSTPTTVQVSNSQTLQYTSTPTPTSQAEAAAGGGGIGASSSAGKAATQALNTAATQGAQNANRIASTNISYKLPTSSLYQINSNPGATYLVQTDPAFTNRNNWLSSDYISTRQALDPNVTQKRLGDGFYEQQLVREQVAQLTGQRFLANYTSDQEQYQALMNSGLTFANAFNLREGIALSAAQMALLTTDIVWLQTETITLADGSTTQALVPHVYAALKDGDLSPSGALLGGNTVAITTQGDLTNSGTIAGRKTLSINAQNINNLSGQISGGDVSLSAKQDINNTGGAISADNNLSLQAGRDINSASTTQSSAGSGGNGYQFSQSGIDRLASLYTRGPGTLLASAGNNINLTAAQVVGGGDVQMQAGNNLNLNTVTTGRSDNFNAGDPNNHFTSSSSKEVGSSIQSKGNTALAAGNTLQATAAQVAAQGDLYVNANNIVLLAGQSKAQSESVMTNTSGDMLSSSTTVTKQSSASARAQVNQLSGSNVTITAEQDLVSVGTQFKATGKDGKDGTGNLTVEGKNSQTFYAAKDVTQNDMSVETSSSMFGGAISLGNSTTTDSSTQQVSIASTLESTQAINVRVGNSATFEGAELSAKTTTFTKTDPNKAGQLNLNGSADTSQTAHTEKSDTMGVYQSQSGSGSTTQTLNLTKINGNVTIDESLAVAVQLPKVVTTSGEKANTTAANTAANATSQASVQAQIDQLSQQPGLAYLGQLSSKAAKANPAQWSQVQLAHDNWSYSQQGLTPAGAALLSIAVAVASGGAAAGLAGSIAGEGVMATAMAAGFSTLAAQASVAMVNNGGDIGKTLSQLGSNESIKNLLTVMATAGALQSLDKALGFTDSTQTVTGQNINPTGINPTGSALSSSTSGIATTQATNAFQQNLLKNISNNIAGSAIDAAISGKAFDEKSLSTALTNGLITAGMAQGANSIGGSSLDDFSKKVAHAALGCAGGAATGGSCKSGAVGAVVGELAAEYINPNADPALKEQTLAFAKTMAAVAGVVVGGGGNNAADVNVAATAGANAAENNYLSPKNNLKRNNAQDACAKDPGSSACNTAAKLNAIDQRTDEALAKVAAACTPGNLAACQELIRTVNQLSSAGKAELQTMMNELQPSCAPPRDCTQATNWANNELKGLERLAGSAWRTNASGQLEQAVGPEGVVAGGTLAALRLSALGFSAGASFDAAGQLLQNGTVRWEQSWVAGITAGVGTPLAARGGWRTAGVAGGLASAANTTFNNVYYGEETNIWIAAGLGAGAGAIAPGVGRWFSNLATPWLTQTPRISISGATPTFPTQSRWPGAPGGVKTAAETTVGNIPSFIPLDNGKQETK